MEIITGKNYRARARRAAMTWAIKTSLTDLTPDEFADVCESRAMVATSVVAATRLYALADYLRKTL